MAVDTPTKPHGAPPENKWRTFVQKKLGHPELGDIEHLENYSDFASHIARVDPEEKNAAQLWIDLQTLKQQQQKQEHELALEERAHEEEHAVSEHETDAHSEHDENTHHESSSENKGQKAVDILLKFKKPRFLEEDTVLSELIEKRQHKWEKENKEPDKHASAEEKHAYEEKLVDFSYGNLDGTSPSVEALAREDYVSEYTEDKKGNKVKKSEKEIQRDKEAIAKYNENANKFTKKAVWGLGKERAIKFDEDYQMHHVKANISAEAAARYDLLKRNGLKGTNLDQSYKAVLERIQKKQWEEYFKRHPQKAEHFAREDYKNRNKEEQEAFNAFKKHHNTWKEELAKQQNLAQTPPNTQHAESSTPSGQPLDIAEPVITPSTTTPLVTDPTVTPTQKELTQEEKVEQALAQMKERRAKEAAQTQQQQQQTQTQTQTQGPQPTDSSQPVPPTKKSIYASTPHEQTVRPPSPPSTPIPHNIPSQGAVRPAASVSYTHPPKLQKAQGQARMAGKLMPKNFRWRNPSFANPSHAPSFRRTAPLDRLNSGISNGVNAVQSAVDTVNSIKNIASTVKTLAMLSNPITLTIIGIIVFLIIIVLIFFMSGNISLNASPFTPEPTPTASGTTIPGLTITLTGPIQVNNSDDIQYTIDATYSGSDEVTLTDPLPPNTTYVSATGTFTKDGATLEESKTVSWKLSENEGGDTSPKKYTFTITLHPTQDDILVKNKIGATAQGGSGEPPNESNCNGTYALNNPFNNFGDPSCNFDKDQAYTMIKQLDPANADRWFFKIIPCESAYNPNAYLRASASGLGAFGLFQMNPKGQGNGQYDAGNVDWHVQIPNAISYNKLINGSFAYWACK